jgi:heme-degrading monooxygenase HmoA
MFIVTTRTFYKYELNDHVLDLAKRSYPIFNKQKGLISIQIHKAHDGSHIMSYMNWESKEDHEACMVSPDFAPVNGEWQELFGTGKAQFELNTYETIAS